MKKNELDGCLSCAYARWSESEVDPGCAHPSPAVGIAREAGITCPGRRAAAARERRRRAPAVPPNCFGRLYQCLATCVRCERILPCSEAWSSSRWQTHSVAPENQEPMDPDYYDPWEYVMGEIERYTEERTSRRRALREEDL